MEDNKQIPLADAIYLTLHKAAGMYNPDLFNESAPEAGLYARDSLFYDFAAMRFYDLAHENGMDLSTIAALWCSRFCESEEFRASFLREFDEFLSELPEDGSDGCLPDCKQP